MNTRFSGMAHKVIQDSRLLHPMVVSFGRQVAHDVTGRGPKPGTLAKKGFKHISRHVNATVDRVFPRTGNGS